MANLLGPRTVWQENTGHHLTGEAWANVNAFVARVYAVVRDGPRLDLWSLFAMIEALEQPRTSRQLDDLLPAAAAWIVHAGKELKSNDFPYAYYHFDDDEAKRDPWSKGELWTGRNAFNPERWDFWRQRFKEISESSDVSDRSGRLLCGL